MTHSPSPVLTFAVATALVAGSSLAHGQVSDLAGRWSYHGKQTELVVQPRIKLQPYVAAGSGFNYGGSVGYGSATTTTVVNEAKPAVIARDMTLEIQPSGAAQWRVSRQQTLENGCVQTIHQVKHGRISAAGDRLMFDVSDGLEEESTSTCAQNTRRSLPAVVETYGLSRAPTGLSLSGGGVTWIFSRG